MFNFEGLAELTSMEITALVAVIMIASSAIVANYGDARAAVSSAR